MSRALSILVLAGLAGLAPACGDNLGPSDPGAWLWELPDGVPLPRVPADNPMTLVKVELGRYLFYDTGL
jgi:cytochrome c peroxidase